MKIIIDFYIQLYFKKCKEIWVKLHNRHWCEHIPKPVEPSPDIRVTILWNQQVQTDRTIPYNTPDTTMRDNEKNNIVDIAVLGDENLIKKEAKLILKYENLTIETQRMWNVKAKVISVIKESNHNHLKVNQKIPEQRTG